MKSFALSVLVVTAASVIAASAPTASVIAASMTVASAPAASVPAAAVQSTDDAATTSPENPASPFLHPGLHPDVVLRDRDGTPVVASGNPVSPMQSCNRCHDTAWIEEHNAHAWLGLDEAGLARSGRAFDGGTGPINRWDPITYDRVDFDGDFTIGIADWLRRHGARHVGGGFATVDTEGRSLLDLEAGDEPAAFTHARTDDGAITAWDWNESGVAELNCFLCHGDDPANEARIAELSVGRFGTAAIATLANTGLVERDGEAWEWVDALFDEKGAVSAATLGLRSATAENCGQCHGAVVTSAADPFFVAPDPRRRQTETTGAIFAPGRIARSGMNVAGRDTLARAWDVHAERLVDCTDCHASTNNPGAYAEANADRPDHLRFDARRLDVQEYLKRPSHDLAKGRSAQGTMRDHLDGSIRTCADCHDASAAHEWLPYRDRHFAALECAACHVPRSMGPARQTTDWTVLTADGEPRVLHRGAHGDPQSASTLLEGFRPVLLPRTGPDGERRLAPHNLVSTWYWYDTARERPVTREELHAAWFDGDDVRPEIRRVLDATGNGTLEPIELGLLHDHQIEAVAARLRATGVRDPKIRAETQAYRVSHGVAGRGGATRDCSTCHGETSRVGEDFVLADFAPGGVLPTLVGDGGVEMPGEVHTTSCGHVVVTPDPDIAGLYLLGFSRAPWVDRIGVLAVLMVIAGVVLHGGLRVVLWAARRQRATTPELEPRTEAAR